MNSEKIKRIQDIFTEASSYSIEFPSIVVLGSQSSGKSSVLEQILQKEFLPRGTNLVTRCPIVIHTKPTNKRERIEIVTSNERVEVNSKNVQDTLMRIMDSECGNNKNICNKPITVELYTANKHQMTLVDLPGLTKVPIGDQPKDIEMQIENMCLEYISRKSVIILVVINANVDIATCDGLKLAKKVDPNFDRTMGVVTKIDLMDSGTDCLRVLENTHPILKYGYVGVLNRSHTDLSSSVTISQMIKKEAQFFKYGVYNSLLPKIGSVYLQQRLHEIFYEILSSHIGPIRVSIAAEIDKYTEELRNLGYGNVNKQRILGGYYNTLQLIYKQETDMPSIFEHKDLCIIAEFKNIFGKLEIVYDFKNVKQELRNSTSIFLCDEIFKAAVTRNAIRIQDVIFGKYKDFFNLANKKLQSIKSRRYPELTGKLNSLVCSKLDEHAKEAYVALEKYVRIQCAYINIQHPDFSYTEIPTSQSWHSFLRPISTSTDETGDGRYDLLVRLSTRYLDIVKKELLNYSTKSAFYSLIACIKDQMQEEILFYGLSESLFEESKEVVRERAEKSKKLDVLKRCHSVLSEE